MQPMYREKNKHLKELNNLVNTSIQDNKTSAHSVSSKRFTNIYIIKRKASFETKTYPELKHLTC